MAKVKDGFDVRSCFPWKVLQRTLVKKTEITSEKTGFKTASYRIDLQK
jgi:hypothetical protein